MPSYIGLHRYTAQGIQAIKESPQRIEAGRQAAQKLGVEVRAVYGVLGQYDLVSLFDAPDDETAARFALALASQGNVSTETLRAFGEEEFRQLVAALP